jgi:hypothetical protein
MFDPETEMAIMNGKLLGEKEKLRAEIVFLKAQYANLLPHHDAWAAAAGRLEAENKRLQDRWTELENWVHVHASVAKDDYARMMGALVSFFEGDCEHDWECEGVCDLCYATLDSAPPGSDAP